MGLDDSPRGCIAGGPPRDGRGRAQDQTARAREGDDARTGVPAGVPAGAMCVQRLDGSLNSAIHITYRSSPRSSSMPEPRDPLLKVLRVFIADHRRPQRRVLQSTGGPPRRARNGTRPGAVGGAPAEATGTDDHG